MQLFKTTDVPTEEVSRDDEFAVVGSARSLGYNQPQLAGRKLWLPMFIMAPMGYVASFIVGIAEANTDRSDIDQLQT
ncbi:MAG: hypothetical protein ACE5GB_01360, partial [Acidimicrobiales bacterium]